MIEDATHDDPHPLGLRARLAAWVGAVRHVCEDVSDTVTSWWIARFPGGPSVPAEDVKRRYGL